MSLYFPEENVLYIHIARTAGTWMEKACLAAEIPFEQASVVGHRHGYAAHYLVDRKLIERGVRNARKFAFIRHPADWYESWWAYQTGRWSRVFVDNYRWHPQAALYSCRSDNFNEFVCNVLDAEPAYVSRMYEGVLGPEGQPFVDEIGRLENLMTDALRILKQFFPKRRVAAIEGVGRQNASNKRKLKWEIGLREKVCAIEVAAMVRWLRVGNST